MTAGQPKKKVHEGGGGKRTLRTLFDVEALDFFSNLADGLFQGRLVRLERQRLLQRGNTLGDVRHLALHAVDVLEAAVSKTKRLAKGHFESQAREILKTMHDKRNFPTAIRNKRAKRSVPTARHARGYAGVGLVQAHKNSIDLLLELSNLLCYLLKELLGNLFNFSCELFMLFFELLPCIS
jgi:hypothetical protein